jgi:small subunit ribosomal protein S9
MTEKKDTKITFSGKYTPAIGRRKTSAAQVRLYKKGSGNIVVNGLPVSEYFSATDVAELTRPLKLTNLQKDFDFSVVVKGGGKKGQAHAVRHGISRVLVKEDEKLREVLKTDGLLTRDDRKKERKKPGLKKARKAPQWSKR